MTLRYVLEGVELRSQLATDLLATEVIGLEYDSRRVETGHLFFAFAGAHADGRKFGQSAVEKGAVAVVSEASAPDGFRGTWIEVEHGRRALALSARNFYGKPDE